MPTPTPNHPAMPLCSALAADPERDAFAVTWNLFLTSSGEFQHIYRDNLQGILYAYRELGVIKYGQQQAIFEELQAFVWGKGA